MKTIVTVDVYRVITEKAQLKVRVNVDPEILEDPETLRAKILKQIKNGSKELDLHIKAESLRDDVRWNIVDFPKITDIEVVSAKPVGS